jgi:tryptophan synthase alpha chain
MSRIENVFQTLKSKNRKALITFIMGGDPNYETSLVLLKSLPQAGADIIELGMPFTDPMADGPVIQLAGQRALNGGATLARTLEMVQDFRKENQSTPVVMMGYFNPVHAFGSDRFIAAAQAAGVDGLILVDLPPEEDQDFRMLCQNAGIDLIRLLTPTSDEARLKILLEGASGFLYYVSITGVTGAAKADESLLAPHIAQIRQHSNLPIALGFGIRTPEDAARMGALADAVVVGSALVQTISESKNPKETLNSLVQNLAKALLR